MPTPVVSPGTVAIIVTVLAMGFNAIGVTIPNSQVNAIVQWGVDGVGVISALIAIYRHWQVKADVVTLSNQITAAGSVPKAGPAQGQVATPARMAAAKSNPTGGVS